MQPPTIHKAAQPPIMPRIQSKLKEAHAKRKATVRRKKKHQEGCGCRRKKENNLSSPQVGAHRPRQKRVPGGKEKAQSQVSSHAYTDLSLTLKQRAVWLVLAPRSRSDALNCIEILMMKFIRQRRSHPEASFEAKP